MNSSFTISKNNGTQRNSSQESKSSQQSNYTSQSKIFKHSRFSNSVAKIFTGEKPTPIEKPRRKCKMNFPSQQQFEEKHSRITEEIKLSKKQIFKMLCLNQIETASTASSSEVQGANSKMELSNQKLSDDITSEANKFQVMGIPSSEQIKEENSLEEQPSPPLSQLQQDGLIDSSNNLLMQELKNCKENSEQILQEDTQQSLTSTSTSSFLKKLQSKQFFAQTPKSNTSIEYYMHYLYNQTLRSSEVRQHAKNNFNQLQYMKEVLPELDKLEAPIISIAKPEHKKNMKTLLLDLDETLVHFVDFPDSSSCINSVHDINLQPCDDLSPMVIQLSLRPGLQKFLETVTKMFEVIVFTASEMIYAKKTVEMIDPKGCIDAIIDRKSCIKIDDNQFIKDIHILDRDKESVIIVDNSLSAVKQLEALIPIVPYFGDENDRQLLELIPYLTELSKSDNVIKKNKQMFQWDLFSQVAKYEDYFKTIRMDKKLELELNAK